MPSLPRRWTAVFALALWTAAGFAPLAVALHVALHPQEHGEHLHTQHLRTLHVHEGHDHGKHSHHHKEAREQAEHARAVADPLPATRHGHPHDAEAVPDHDPTAVARGPVTHPEPSSVALPALTALGPGAPSGHPSDLGRMPHRGPPVPLFTTHCSLLL